MKRTLLLILLVAAGCAKKDEPPKAEEKKPDAPWKLSHNTNGEPVFVLDEATQTRIGLQLAPLAAAQLSPEIRAVGRVLEPAGVSSLVADFISARAAAEASAMELERSKTLAKSENVSARAFQAAEANAARDAAQLEAARAKLISALGKELAARENLAEWVKSLTMGTSALVRLELPPGEATPSQLTAARLISMVEGSKPSEGKFVGAAAVDSLSQTRGLLLLVEPNAAGFSPGEAVTGFITVPGEAQSGIIVPRNAVMRKDGLAWVYVQTGETEFVRREVSTDRSAEGGWFVTRNFAAGDKVVTAGAQIILSTEMSAAGFSDGEHH